jgi:hypothetical protein
MVDGWHGRFIRINRNDPATEKTYLKATNGSGFFTNLGDNIAVGGWINPTTYSIGAQYSPIFNTRQGPGQPLFYLSLISGKPRMMLYSSAGSLLLDQSETPPVSFVNNGWYFLGALIGVTGKSSQMLICDRSSGAAWIAPGRTYTGALNSSCAADIVLGMHADQYYYAGGLDDWFFETATKLTMDDLVRYFWQSMLANGADTSGMVDALVEPGAVVLRKSAGVYPDTGVVETVAVPCSLASAGRVAVKSEYTAGTTAISRIETATSDDLISWTAWQATGASGELLSPDRAYIRYRVTLTTSDPTRTPRLREIALHEIPQAPYQRLGYARPVVLSRTGKWDAVLENAFDVIVTGEVNSADTLEFKLPYNDAKRLSLDNELEIQIAGDMYRVRTMTDDKGEDGAVLSSVYAEAAFYDLAYSAEKQPVEFNADAPDAAMRYALDGTDWSVGTVNVRTLRTWQ